MKKLMMQNYYIWLLTFTRWVIGISLVILVYELCFIYLQGILAIIFLQRPARQRALMPRYQTDRLRTTGESEQAFLDHQVKLGGKKLSPRDRRHKWGS